MARRLAAQLLPTDHFHVIFTLPSELHELWQWNREQLTEVLFGSVRETLLTLLGDPEMVGRDAGDVSGVAYVGPHVHVTSARALPGQRRRPDADGQWHAVRTGFLLPVAVVRALFRGKVLGALEALWLTGQLQLPPHLDDDGMRRCWSRRRGSNGISALPSAIRMAAA